ncbi:MAG: phosphoglucosamine mutase [Sulfobacillus acidophilus]|uniref:Phosphoglucosamine mutase n=1 Tax=Sulfobacillus acidophilus TaxID=53633 RepID=A0A2T2WMP2_9FIRM|nr:MAG: phosphoglucosamine mutase [Sulfobacillus acidophilus]
MPLALFGTDGARGIANDTLTVALALDIARGAVVQLDRPARVVIGRDTRVSGPMLEAALAAGFTEFGADVMLVGMVPTPALAYLIPAMHADVGVMISASHNPPQYNGIKLLDRAGRKWESDAEARVERAIRQRRWPEKSPDRVGRIFHYEDSAVLMYRRHLLSIFAGQIAEDQVVLDVGHGAAAFTAPDVFQALGVKTTVLNAEPLGELINVNCGATHPERVREAVLRIQASLGLAFDGDADRVIAVDGSGRIIDGDEILYVLATELERQGELVNHEVVATVMSNLGLERALRQQGIRLVRTPVGDRWVAKTMRDSGAVLGGEQSGHVILKKWTETGDGLLTGLALLAAIHARDVHLGEAVSAVERYPQILRNVVVDTPVEDWRRIVGLAEAVEQAEEALGEEGRVLVRPSGTEPLLRIMLEGRDVELIQQWAHRLESVVREALESAEAQRQ